MSWKVIVTHKIPDAGTDLLHEHGLQVEIFKSGLSAGEIARPGWLNDAEALLCLLTDSINARLIDHAPRLKIIANYAVGYNNIDIAACTRRGIAVTNTPGVLTEATADMAITLMLAAAKRVVEGDTFTRKGLFKGWEPMLMLGADFSGKTLGIIGAGRIGQAVAKRASGFDMKILYSDHHRIEELEKVYQAKKVEMPKLLKESDFVTLHVPLDDSTYHLINAGHLAMMKPGAFLINTSRGPVVDEKALFKALKKKTIAGAGLDVYENEPEITPGLTDLPNIIVLLHIASATVETRDKMARIAAENIIAMSQNQRPPNMVNPEIFYKNNLTAKQGIVLSD